ncbi:hypothetical protein Tco_1389168 [Tanacetum coccineum]
MIKNSKRPLLDSSKSKDSKEVVKNNMRTELRVSEMDDNIRVEREVGTENIGLKSYGESGKEDVDGDKNKCLEVTNNFASEKYGIEDKNKRMGFSSLVYGGEIIDGAYSCDRNKSNVRSSANEQESVSSKALKESNNNDLNIKLLVNEKATMREFLSGHSKMLEEETLKVADQKEDKESSVKGNKMFPNESVDSDTVDSEFMVMEVDEFQNVGKGKCNKLVENKDEYGGEQDGSKEDNNLIVCDLVLRKCYDGRYFEDQVGGYKSFNVFAYDSDVHNPSTKVVTCEDELYMNERKTENSEMGSAILKLDIWKWPKREKPRYTNYNSKSRRWKFDIWRWPNKKKGKWEESHY